MKIIYSLALLLTAWAAVADNFEDMRQKALNRKRTIIYNTDGCDAVYYPKNLAASKENFIKQRLAFTRNTAIDTVFYCPLSSGFTHLTSRTQAGDQLLSDAPHDKRTRNVTGELLQMGTDPLKIAEEYCRAEGLEFFASLRVNDTHDESHRPNRPYFLMNKFKRDNPQFLIGSADKRPPYCAWSAVDFSHKEVRERMKNVVREICSNYDIDGIEFDFFRHLQLLKSVAWNGKATSEDLEMMTRFMRELRSITEDAGRRRGRPILVAIRTADSIGYSRTMGIDLERWMQEKLFDIWIGGGYFQLNSWSESVKIARKYDLKFYASLDESRISGYLPMGNRNSDAVFASRVATAMAEGCDGFYCFNLEQKLLTARTRGGVKAYENANKVYYATVRGGHSYINRYIADGSSWNNLILLSQQTPKKIAGGKNLEFDIFIADKFPCSKNMRLNLTAQLRTADKAALKVTINGNLLKLNRIADDVQEFIIDEKTLKHGNNHVVISSNAADKLNWNTVLAGNRILSGAVQYPWRRIYQTSDFKRSEVIVNGSYRLDDFMNDTNHAASFMYPLTDFNDPKLQYSFELKVEKSAHPEAIVARTAFAGKTEVITFEPDKISCKFAGKSVKFNTADKFHSYHVTADGKTLQLFADGKEILSVPLVMNSSDKRSFVQDNSETVDGMNDKSIIIGSITAPGTGSSLWRNVKLAQTGCQVSDFAIAVRYNPAMPPALNDVADLKIQPFASAEIKNNKLVVKGMRSSYKAHLTPVENGAVLLIHDSGNKSEQTQCFMQNRGTGLDNLPEVVVGEWNAKALGNKRDFQMTLALECKDKSIREMQFFLNSRSILFNNRSIAVESFKPDKFNTIRFAFDTRTGEYAIWCNQKLADNGRLSPRTNRKNSFLTCGDGSSGVSGRVYLQYFRLGSAASTKTVLEKSPVAGKTVLPIAAIEIEEGKLKTTGLRNTYKPHLSKIQGDAIHFVHTSTDKAEAYQFFAANSRSIFNDLPEILVGEWLIRIPAELRNTKSFIIAAAVPCKQDQKLREIRFVMTPSGMLFNNRSITKAEFKKDQFNLYRFELNTVNGKCRVFCNGILINESTAKASGSKAGYLTIGDGSGSISGEAYVQYLRIGKENN